MEHREPLTPVRTDDGLELIGRSGPHPGLLVVAVAATMVVLTAAPLLFDASMWGRSSGLFGSPGAIALLAAPLAAWAWWGVLRSKRESRLVIAPTELRLTTRGSSTAVPWSDVTTFLPSHGTESVRVISIPDGGGTRTLLEIEPEDFHTSAEALIAFLERHLVSADGPGDDY